MAIFLNENSRVIVQGMTGSEGSKHTRRMLASGTNIVGGVNARKAGTTVDFDGTELPVFGSVAEAMDKTGADVSVLFVPPAFTKDAIIEAIDAEIGLAVVITEGVPVHDSASPGRTPSRTTRQQDPDHRAELPGHHLAREVQRRHHPGEHHRPGPDRAGLQVRHADLPDDVRAAGSRVLHRDRHRRRPDHRDHPHRRAARRSRPTTETDAIVMIGEIGGDAEERAAAFIADNVTQAGRRVRRRVHRPRGQDHGPRRRDRVRLGRHRPGQEGSPRGRRRQGRQDAVGDRAAAARRHRLSPPGGHRAGHPHHDQQRSPPESHPRASGRQTPQQARDNARRTTCARGPESPWARTVGWGSGGVPSPARRGGRVTVAG